ncbi:MAG: phosphoribosylaminoimidazolesuccinocarboxamide synthase [Defluviitaleaceae bacterium]|nr:phosphoribosylaminoimidazolesuccinocarboxamide synthase [Defluviitaleaceae bacterium]
MKHVYEGKTKKVFELPDGNYLIKFKDEATGENGVFDPGANTVGLTIEGMGKACLKMTDYYFNKINDAGIPTHYVSANIDDVSMTVLPAKTIGRGLEVICRFRATGSFMRRYALYANEGQELDAFVEVTLKDDDRLDPPISKDALQALGLLDGEKYEELKILTQRIAKLIKQDLEEKGMELYDIKLEFGFLNGTNELALIDEISGGNMRVFKDGKSVLPLELVNLVI